MIYFVVITILIILAIVGVVCFVSNLNQIFGLLDSIENSIEKISEVKE